MNKKTAAAMDLQIMWNRLLAVVEEQARTLIRTSFSTSVREAEDLSAGIFDRRTRMMAQAVTGTPGHVNSMAESVAHFAREIGRKNIFPGDVYITNDPWLGTGHLHDITMVSPAFHRGTLIAFLAATAHVVDIGGRGLGPDAGEVYEEGLRIPIMKFADRGDINQELLRIVRANVREADQVAGDMHSLAACCRTGERRLREMMAEFNLRDIEKLSNFIIGVSRRRTREKIAALPDGVFKNEMTVDGYDAPVHMKVAVNLRGDSLAADFAGTSPASRFGVNVPMVYTRAYACYALKCAVAPEVPNNAGALSPFHITAPAGSILNAQPPAAVAVRHVLGHFIPDVVLGALAPCLPDIIPAEGAGALWIVQISVRPIKKTSRKKSAPPPTAPKNTEVLMFTSGGTGARPTLDGLSATAYPSGVRTMSVEATEQIGPLIVWRKELREGSGGGGEYRGGLGQVIEIAPRDGYELFVNAMFDRIRYPARGRNGGRAGWGGKIELADGTVLRGKGRQHVPAGARLILSLPGGGGFGDGKKRSKDKIQNDLRSGYISPLQAAKDYGVK